MRAAIGLVVTCIALATPASAEITIYQAQITPSGLSVSGRIQPQVPNITLTISPGKSVEVPTRNGRFTWQGMELPTTCIIEASAGSDKKTAMVQNCGVQGSVGPAGPQGPPGPPGASGATGTARTSGAAGTSGSNCDSRAAQIRGVAAQALIGVSVHSSAASDFVAPIARSKRSVVARSAPMPFSSCPIERNPLAARGSLSI